MTHPWISQCACAIPEVAPAPASPIKCSDPMFEANMEAPMASQVAVRPLRKYSPDVSFLLRATSKQIHNIPRKNNPMTIQSHDARLMRFRSAGFIDISFVSNVPFFRYKTKRYQRHHFALRRHISPSSTRLVETSSSPLACEKSCLRPKYAR